jgi:hypothetical protein
MHASCIFIINEGEDVDAHTHTRGERITRVLDLIAASVLVYCSLSFSYLFLSLSLSPLNVNCNNAASFVPAYDFIVSGIYYYLF